VDGNNDYRFCLTSCFKLYFYTKCPDAFSWIYRSDTKLFKQGYVSPRLKSSLQTLYRRHHDLIDRCEIFISQMIMNLVHFAHIFYFLYHRSIRMWIHCSHHSCLGLIHDVFGGLHFPHRFSFLCCVVFRCFVCPSPSVSCAQCCRCLLIVHSWLPISFSLTCIYFYQNTDINFITHHRGPIKDNHTLLTNLVLLW